MCGSLTPFLGEGLSSTEENKTNVDYASDEIYCRNESWEWTLSRSFQANNIPLTTVVQLLSKKTRV